MEYSRKWLFVRVGALLVAACLALFLPAPEHPDYLHPAPLKFLGIISGFVLFGIAVVVSSMAKRADGDLYRPSWFVNPFLFSQPFNYYDFSAQMITAYGLGGAVNLLFVNKHNWFWEIPVAIGISGILSIRAAMLGNRDKLVACQAPNQSSEPTPASGTSPAEQEPRLP